MSKLQELIDRLCPNGVEFGKLGDYIDIYTGSQFNKRDMNDAGSYPVINGGVNASGYIESFNEEAKTITISQGGASAGYVAWQETPFWAGAHCYVVRPSSSAVLNRFLYFFLKNQEVYLQQMQHGAGIPALNRDKVKSLLFPLVPIEVQEEIVKILDRFADYAAELQAELQARKEQYEYYRNLLLTFNTSAYGCGTDDAQKDCLWLTLKDVAIIKNGKDYKHCNNGDYPVYGSGGIMTYVDQYCYDKPTVILPRKGSIGKIHYLDTPFWNVDTAYYTIINTQLIVPKFLYYFLTTIDLEKKNCGKGAVPSLTQDILYRISIPIPPLELQEKIVAILDRFETLVNDLSKGLPAEIEAVKARYEYYRNKLLTFNPLSA